MIVAEVCLRCIQNHTLICSVLSCTVPSRVTCNSMLRALDCLTAPLQVLQEEFVQNFQGFSNNYPVLGKCVRRSSHGAI